MGVESWSPILQGFLGGLFTWGCTAFGAALVFFTFRINQKLMDLCYGFAAGVMIAASCFGLLKPAMDASADNWAPRLTWVPAALGFSVGVIFLLIVQRISHVLYRRHYMIRAEVDTANPTVVNVTELETYEAPVPVIFHDSQRSSHCPETGLTVEVDQQEDTDADCKTRPTNAPDQHEERFERWQRLFLLIFAITLHNIPEGMAVGVTFGAAASAKDPSAAFGTAVAVCVGIGIQDIPEGMAVAFPLRREGMSRWMAFLNGQFSGFVEPLGALIGAAAVIGVQGLLPYALSFAAGAMIFVAVEELIPESQKGGNKMLATIGTLVGFLLMMILDVALS